MMKEIMKGDDEGKKGDDEDWEYKQYMRDFISSYKYLVTSTETGNYKINVHILDSAVRMSSEILLVGPRPTELMGVTRKR